MVVTIGSVQQNFINHQSFNQQSLQPPFCPLIRRRYGEYLQPTPGTRTPHDFDTAGLLAFSPHDWRPFLAGFLQAHLWHTFVREYLVALRMATSPSLQPGYLDLHPPPLPRSQIFFPPSAFPPFPSFPTQSADTACEARLKGDKSTHKTVQLFDRCICATTLTEMRELVARTRAANDHLAAEATPTGGGGGSVGKSGSGGRSKARRGRHTPTQVVLPPQYEDLVTDILDAGAAGTVSSSSSSGLPTPAAGEESEHGPIPRVPKGWRAAWSERRGRWYYVHEVGKETSWTLPEGLDLEALPHTNQQTDQPDGTGAGRGAGAGPGAGPGAGAGNGDGDSDGDGGATAQPERPTHVWNAYTVFPHLSPSHAKATATSTATPATPATAGSNPNITGPDTVSTQKPSASPPLAASESPTNPPSTSNSYTPSAPSVTPVPTATRITTSTIEPVQTPNHAAVGSPDAVGDSAARTPQARTTPSVTLTFTPSPWEASRRSRQRLPTSRSSGSDNGDAELTNTSSGAIGTTGTASTSTSTSAATSSVNESPTLPAPTMAAPPPPPLSLGPAGAGVVGAGAVGTGTAVPAAADANFRASFSTAFGTTGTPLDGPDTDTDTDTDTETETEETAGAEAEAGAGAGAGAEPAILAVQGWFASTADFLLSPLNSIGSGSGAEQHGYQRARSGSN